MADHAELPAFDPTVSARRGMPMTISSADYRIRSISEAYCATLKRSRDEVLHTEWRDLVHPDDVADPAAKQAVLLATGEPYSVNCRVRRSDGQWLLGHYQVSRLEFRSGRGPLVQSSAWFEEIAAPLSALPSRLPSWPEMALTEYIQSIATDLAGLAGRNRLEMLQHLLSMVSLEAADQLQRRLHCLLGGSAQSRLN